ncbi:Tyrosine--tRNA ligase 1, cytoplasmic [Linum perenne]
MDIKPETQHRVNSKLQTNKASSFNRVFAAAAGYYRSSTMSSSEQEPSPPSEELKSLTVGSSSESNSSVSQEMSPEEKFRIVRSVGEECIQEDELLNLLTKKPQPICYDGFEPSGRMHIAQGVMKTINVNKLTSAGCKVKIWIADWFAQLNNKMGGDLKKIRVVGEYLIEIWKAVGMDLEGGNVEFLWSSDEINSRAAEYWPLVMDIARKNKLPRITRCVQIMGRNEKDELTAAQILYPCMQCDMLPGLQEGQEKMSKSDPSSSIFMEDEEAEVNVKIKKAFCPPKVVQGNPCLEYIKFIVLPWFNEFTVERNPQNGGNKTFTNFEELVADYEIGALHPGDLKPALSKALNKILQPVRNHFTNNARAKDLLKRVKGYRITR